jgi:Excalibur calcium-binding domain
VRSLDQVQWQQLMQWIRTRPWQVWATAGAVFALFAVLGAIGHGSAPALTGAHSLADGLEQGAPGDPGVAATGSAGVAVPRPGYPGVAYPTAVVPVSPSAPTPTPTVLPQYASCAAAEAAGVVSIRRGQPGYRTALDRDGDGIACDHDEGAAPTSAPPVRPSPIVPGTIGPSPTPDPSATPEPTTDPSPTPSPTDNTDPAVPPTG